MLSAKKNCLFVGSIQKQTANPIWIYSFFFIFFYEIFEPSYFYIFYFLVRFRNPVHPVGSHF